MRIGIIGAGNVGGALAKGWAKAGYDIVLGVRDANDAALKPLLAASNVQAVDPARAAAMGDVVVLALPWGAAESALKALGDLSGKIVIDCMNPLIMADGALTLDRGFTTSGGETVAQWLPGARVVKTLNQIGAELMDKARSLDAPPCMFIAGDDDAAKASVRTLVESLGFETFDAGGLKQSRILEPLGMVWINQTLFRGAGRDWAFGVRRVET